MNWKPKAGDIVVFTKVNDHDYFYTFKKLYLISNVKIVYGNSIVTINKCDDGEQDKWYEEGFRTHFKLVSKAAQILFANKELK